jgi:hypothetical protein
MEVNAGQQIDTQNPAEAQAPEAAPAATQAADLDGFSKFVFQGEEYTPDRLHEIVNGFKKYSETAKQREEREYYESNLRVDLPKLLKDPSLADAFRQSYPKEYHWYLESLPSKAQPDPAQSHAAQPALPPEVLEKIQKMEARLKFHDERTYNAEVKAATAEIDKITKPLYEKYDLADEDAVLAKADALLGQQVKLTPAVWERLIRENHEKMEKRADQRRDARLKSQLEKGRRAADVGPGGATPGQAPQGPRTLEEAREAMLKAAYGGR